MKKYSFLLLTIITSLILSCSADYDYSSNFDVENLAFINLSSNATNQGVIGLNQTLELTVTDAESGEDITETSTLYIDDTQINGNTYDFTEAGSYTFSASINDVSSNSVTIKVVDGNYATATPTKAMPGEEVQLRLYNSEGEDITQNATFSVNGNNLESNTFQTDQDGSYEATATADNSTSNTSFEVFTPKRKVVLEDYTGSWCGWCPRVLMIVDEVKQITDDVVVLAIHKGGDDEMIFPQVDALSEAFNVGNSLPKLRFNRTEAISVIQDADIPDAVDHITAQAGTPTNTAIAINTSLNGSKLKVDVKVKSKENLPDTYKLAVYLYQNGLVFNQTNYYNDTEGSPWYQLGDDIPNFIHNHVLEASLTDDVLGNNIAQTDAYQTYEENFGVVNLSSYAETANGNTFDPERFSIAVFLVDENNNALNAQAVDAGQSVDFE